MVGRLRWLIWAYLCSQCIMFMYIFNMGVSYCASLATFMLKGMLNNYVYILYALIFMGFFHVIYM